MHVVREVRVLQLIFDRVDGQGVESDELTLNASFRARF